MLEALLDDRVKVARLLISRAARGEVIDEIVAAARRRGVDVERVAAERVTRISRNGRHDQGVVADVDAPGLEPLDRWLARHGRPAPARLVLLDGVNNPANVGMIIRTATAAGLEGVVVPRTGCPDIGPLVIKASAGIAFRSVVLRAASAADASQALLAAGFELAALQSKREATLWTASIGPRVALVVGNETDGISPTVAARVSVSLSIPMAGGVESLNAAAAAAVACYELARRSATLTAS